MIVDIDSTSAAAVLALNNEHADELSFLDEYRLGYLVAQAFYARRIGDVDAFLIAFDQGADYDSPNFQWFKQRYPRFVYFDRLCVAPAARRRGLAHRLYVDAFAHARQQGHRLIFLEVNRDPPNPASDAFHAALGFAEIATMRIDDYLWYRRDRLALWKGNVSKTVRYMARTLDDEIIGDRAAWYDIEPPALARGNWSG